MSNERLIYLPLGGAGEIGMNAYVYGYGKPGKERLIVVDLGVAFPDMDGSPGVDLIIADISWLIERRDQIEAVFITHAHEDHVGAVAHTYEQLQAPIYARRFTANIAARKMAEHHHPDDAVNVVSVWPEQVSAGPFTVGFLPISHSIPESSALVIDTPEGRVIHSGDFKIDLTPGVGEPYDPELWAEVCKDGVKALICDSTNVFSLEPGRSEAPLAAPIEELIKPLAWSNPQTGSTGTIVAIDKFMGKHGQQCRGFKTSVDTFMGIAFYNGEACQISPGEWVLSWFKSSDCRAPRRDCFHFASVCAVVKPGL